ncbi:MAG: hypothetical protein WC508_01230 [Patescibacteria group bacterium]
MVRYNPIKKLGWVTMTLVCLFLANQAQAIGVGVKPKEINILAITGREVISEFLVVNISQEPARYEIYPDGLQRELKLEPTDFRLEPDGSQIVKVKVNLKNPGRFNTNISVVAHPLANAGLAAASGVKIPITIVSCGWWIWYLVGVLVVACLVAIFGVKLLKNRKIKDLKNNPKV